MNTRPSLWTTLVEGLKSIAGSTDDIRKIVGFIGAAFAGVSTFLIAVRSLDAAAALVRGAAALIGLGVLVWLVLKIWRPAPRMGIGGRGLQSFDDEPFHGRDSETELVVTRL